MEIQYIDIDKLREYERNARKHGDEDVNAIAKSIEEFGFNDPVGVWSDDNIIVEGHGRYRAAKQLGMKSLPCIRLDHLSDEKRRAYALAHNRTAELSGWDFNVLDRELAEIKSINMEDYGFHNIEDEELDDLFRNQAENEKKPKMIQCQECGEWFEI